MYITVLGCTAWGCRLGRVRCSVGTISVSLNITRIAELTHVDKDKTCCTRAVARCGTYSHSITLLLIYDNVVRSANGKT
jgi:hypothetical protein